MAFVPWGKKNVRGSTVFEWKKKGKRSAYWRVKIRHRPAKVKTIYCMTMNKGKTIQKPSIIVSFNFFINVDKINARELGLTYTKGKYKRVYYAGGVVVAEITSLLNRIRIRKVCDETVDLLNTILGKTQNDSLSFKKRDIGAKVASPSSKREDQARIPTLDIRGDVAVANRMELIQKWLLVRRIQRAKLLEMSNTQLIIWIRNNCL
ncbi:MAG: hypothetical protein ACPGO5_02040 [Patescibacteria group bacterium]